MPAPWEWLNSHPPVPVQTHYVINSYISTYAVEEFFLQNLKSIGLELSNLPDSLSSTVAKTSVKLQRDMTILNHWGRVTHICVRNLTIIGSDNVLSPSHYLNQCWNIVNWTLRNKLQWNSYIFVEENAFQNVIWKMTAILSRPQYVNTQSSGFLTPEIW